MGSWRRQSLWVWAGEGVGAGVASGKCGMHGRKIGSRLAVQELEKLPVFSKRCPTELSKTGHSDPYTQRSRLSDLFGPRHNLITISALSIALPAALLSSNIELRGIYGGRIDRNPRNSFAVTSSGLQRNQDSSLAGGWLCHKLVDSGWVHAHA